MKVSMETDGLQELDNQMQSLGLIAQKQVLRKATRESAKPILRKMEQNVASLGHVDTGLLKESLNSLMRQFGLNPMKDMPPTVYGYWLEYGVQPHRTGSGSNVSSAGNQGSGLMHPGIPAKPFIRTAFDSQLTSTLGIQKTVLTKEIDKALRKAHR